MIKATVKLVIDTGKVQNKADKAAMRNTTRQAFRVMQISKESIQRGKKAKPSKPGETPKSRTGWLKRGIRYAANAASRSVVIGPQKLAGKSGQAAAVLEHGGVADVAETVPEGVGGKLRWKRTGKRIKRPMAARPFMGPALTKSMSELGSIWRNSVGAK
jgi:hypothetical protein